MQIKRARESFTTEVTGTAFTVQAGQTIEDRHPIARAHPDSFEDFEVDIATPKPKKKETKANGSN